MFKKLAKKFTSDYKEVPLFWATIDLKKYHEDGEKDSCTLKIHPSIKDDEFIKVHLNGLVDHIRKNYDMDELVK